MGPLFSMALMAIAAGLVLVLQPLSSDCCYRRAWLSVAPSDLLLGQVQARLSPSVLSH